MATLSLVSKPTQLKLSVPMSILNSSLEVMGLGFPCLKQFTLITSTLSEAIGSSNMMTAYGKPGDVEYVELVQLVSGSSISLMGIKADCFNL